jgi:hypothetical protein
MVEVVFIVSAFQNRITDDGVRAVDPADNLGVLREQRIEVNRDRTGDNRGSLLHDFCSRSGSGFQRLFRRRLCGRLCADILLIQVVIFLGGGVIAVEGVIELVPGENEDAQEHAAKYDEKTVPEGTQKGFHNFVSNRNYIVTSYSIHRFSEKYRKIFLNIFDLFCCVVK